MSERDFIVVIASIGSALFFIGVIFAKQFADTCYTDKISGILLKMFWGLSIATLFGGFIYQIFIYHT